MTPANSSTLNSLCCSHHSRISNNNRHTTAVITFHRVPVDIRIEIYEYASGCEPIVHYMPNFWVDTTTSSGRWIISSKVGDLPVLHALLEYTLHSISLLPTLQEHDLEILKFKTIYISRILAHGGHFKSLQFAFENDFPFDEETFVHAVTTTEGCSSKKNIPIMHWLRQVVHCPWNSRTYKAAIQSGRLDILEWLHQAHCPWDTNTFIAAVQCGNVNVMSWLRDHNCPYGFQEACACAKEMERHDLVLWLQEEDFYHGINVENYVLDILPFL